MRRVLITAALLAALTPAASASGLDRWQVALQAAYSQWGGPPPCGTPSFDHHAVLPTVSITSTGAPPAMWIQTEADPTIDPCVIHVSEEAEGESVGDACAQVTHEVGHLWGRTHSPDPSNVMFGGGTIVGGGSLGVGWYTPGAWACHQLLKRHQVWWCIKGSCRIAYRWELRASGEPVAP